MRTKEKKRAKSDGVHGKNAAAGWKTAAALRAAFIVWDE